MNETYRIARKLGLIMAVLFTTHSGFSQDAYMPIADTAPHLLFKNFAGIKLFAADFGATSLNRDLDFYYVSVNPATGYKFTFNHDMNVSGLHNFFNGGLGLEENYGKHLVLNFFNASIGYISDALNWNIGAGAGYFISLNKANTWRMNATMNVYYQNIAYSFGDYYDTTLIGFEVDGVNVGSSIKNVKYVNSIFTLSPGIELMYRTPSWDFFAGAYYNYILTYTEKVTFYVHSIPVTEAIYYNNNSSLPPGAPPGPAVGGDILNINKYTFNIGVIREFGL